MPSSRSLVGLFAAALLSTAALGDTINVPGDFPTIQQAIAAAAKGDEVLVADGVYTGAGNWDLDFGGKLITVRSSGGPDQCIIDCAWSAHRGFHFHSGETRAAVVDGFTIRGVYFYGYWDGCAGSAIRCEGSSPTIANCIIEDNEIEGDCLAHGGGIFSQGGSPAILDCTIVGNEVLGYGGSGSAGGGIYCQGGNPIIAGCVIKDNVALPGGGVALWAASALVSNCTFSGNTFEGLNNSDADVTVTNCTFRGNVGHGMVNGFNTVATVVNCTFSGNSGAGLKNSFNNIATVTNCSFSGNLGGGMVDYLANARASNCILWGNSPAQVIHQGITTTVRYSDVEGGYPGFGNIDADPLFVDADGRDGIPGTEDDDLRLQAGSPCIDAGDNWGVGPDLADLDGDGDTAELTALDLGGLSRFADLDSAADTGCGLPVIVDVGAWEYQGNPAPGPIYFADLNGDGSVTIADLMVLSGCLGSSGKGDCCIADLDLDGELGTGDSGLLVAELVEVAPIVVGPEPLPSICEVAQVGPSLTTAVAVSGETALIGATSYVTLDSVSVFGFDGQTWVETQELLASDGQPNDNFGRAVAVDGDTAMVGATGHVHAGQSGAVYAFRYDGARWASPQELIASDGGLGDAFGLSVSLRGDVAVISTPFNDENGSQAGSAYVFRFNPSSGQWLQEQKLLAFGGPSTFFGESVAVSGDVAVVGERYTSPGSAYVFRFNGTSWNQEQKLVPFDIPATGFGASVAVSGDAILVGADWYPGSAHVFRFDPLGAPGSRWAAEQTLLASDFLFANSFGSSVALDGDSALIGARHAQRDGAAYVFRHRKDLGWVEVQRLLPGANASYFGWSVALSGDSAVVGAYVDSPHAASMYAGVSGTAPDCNANGRADTCDLVDGSSPDADGNGVPDECDGP